MKRLLLVLLVAAAVAAVAPWGQHAYAFDLTGGYEGLMTCKGIDNIGEKDTFKCCSILNVKQTGDTLMMAIVDSRFFGRAVEMAGHPDKGVVTAISCSTNTTLPSPSEMGEFQVSANAETERATVKGETILFGNGRHYICKWNYKRTTLSVPTIDPC